MIKEKFKKGNNKLIMVTQNLKYSLDAESAAPRSGKRPALKPSWKQSSRSTISKLRTGEPVHEWTWIKSTKCTYRRIGACQMFVNVCWFLVSASHFSSRNMFRWCSPGASWSTSTPTWGRGKGTFGVCNLAKDWKILEAWAQIESWHSPFRPFLHVTRLALAWLAGGG